MNLKHPKNKLLNELSFDEYDEYIKSPPEEVEFERLIDRIISRRDFLGASTAGVISFGTGTFVTSTAALIAVDANSEQTKPSPVEFPPVAANTLDTITVPQGYNWHVVASWGDPLWSMGAEFDNQTRGTGESQKLAIGDNNDGMDIFFKDGHSIMAVNNEYVNRSIFHGNRDSGLPENKDDFHKSMAAHGVSIFEIRRDNGRWRVVKDSSFNRKITADEPIEITGPARGHELMKTTAEQHGVMSLGTWNNCGNGRTPWGTYLACEENFNGYFSNDDEDAPISPEYQRYGIGNKDYGYDWGEYDQRFRTNIEPNEPNRAGYVVEIDPLDASSLPKKRTALGRFKHENAEVVVSENGKIVVYMGDDERGEFLYKFVSAGKYEETANNTELLDNGDLFAARFNDDGSGEWLALSPQSTGMSRAEISIFSRIAASKVRATTMDRPEWVAANPLKVEAYCCLTNNKNRGIRPNKGGDETPVGGPNPRKKNRYGQIVRWIPDEGQHDAMGFSWDLFVLAGNPGVHAGSDKAGSGNISADNMFNSPDGLRFDSRGGLWIQTDGKYSNDGDFEGMGNNQMLLGDPATGEIKRFLVGPREAEITGATWSQDRKTLFIGVQHPGEKGNSSFPDGEGTVPRSSIIAIEADDGSEMG